MESSSNPDEAVAPPAALYLTGVMRALPMPVAILDRDLRCRQASPALAHLALMPDVETCIGRPLDELLPALAPTLTPLLERAGTGAGAAVDHPLLPDGKRLARIHPLPAPDGSLAGFVLMLDGEPNMPDECLHAEQIRQQGEVQVHRVLDALFVFVCQLAPDGTLLDANRAPLEAAGIGIADVRGLKFWDCYWWSHDAALQDQLREAIAQARAGHIVRHDVVVRMRGDSRMTVDFMLAPLCDDDGKIGRLVASGIDISDRRAGEQALRLSEVRFRHVFEGAPDGIAMVDAAGHMVLVNGTMERLFGYSRQELIGQPIEMLIPDRYLPAHHQLRGNYMKDPTSRDMAGRKELYARRKDNSEFPAEIGLNPLRLPDGIYVLATVFDVTKRRADQQTIERALAEKTALLNEVHHRVKNNLQVISSLLSLQSRHATPEAQSLFAESQGRVKAMALIHQLLYERHDFSRVSLAHYMRRLSNLLRESQSVQVGRVSIELACEEEALSIDLQRAVPCGLLVNELVTNALKHAFPDGRTGTVRIVLARDDDGRGRIIVADNGVGLPPHIEPGAGHSLGFQLIPLLVDQLGGELRLVRDAGTRFEVSFPPDSGADE